MTLTLERPAIAEPIAMVRAPYVAPQADLQETKSPGTVENAGEVGNAWTDPENALASDDSRAKATVSKTGFQTKFLLARDFAFAIPEGASITGIVCSVECCSYSVSNAATKYAQLVQAGAIGGEDRASDAPGLWPIEFLGDAVLTYGASDALWGREWLPSDINDEGFGFAIAAYNAIGSEEGSPAQVDSIAITVYYTEAEDPNRVCFQGRSIDFRTEGVFRQHPEDDVWGEMVNEGFNLQAPPSFLEGRAMRVIITPSTGDLEALADSGTHDIEAVVKYRPAYHFAREAAG